MSSEIEAAGAAVTAGLAGAAIDNAGARNHGETHGACANCGTDLTGEYCSHCGQPAHIHRTLGHMIEEFLHGILHFDTRAWKTLPLLLFRPGTLTRNYVHGMRARYISPLAIFLLTVFTMFFVFALSGGSQIGVADNVAQVPQSAMQVGARAAALANTMSTLREVRAEGVPEDEAGRTAYDARLLAAEQAVAKAQAEVDDVGDEIVARHVDQPAIASVQVGNGEPVEGNLYEEIASAAKAGDLKVNTGWKALDKKIQHKLENPELFIYKLQNTAYKFSFLLIPISLPFLWLMFFWKRGMTLFDHSVFILYSLSFVSLVFVLLSLSAMASVAFGLVSAATVIALPVHFFFHLKGAYALGWFSAFWRTGVLFVFAWISLLIFIAAIVAVGFVG